MTPRLKDIAEQLGLSVTTVSRALAGYDDVAEETRRRVRATAEALGYVPNITARQLQKRRTNLLGLIVPTFGPRFSDPFITELLAGIGNQAERLGYAILTATAAPGPAEMEIYRRHVQSRQADGVLVVRTRRQDERIGFLVNSGFPMVAFGRTELDLDYPWVDVDGIQGLALAVDHLAELGHHRIAFIRPPQTLMFDKTRWQGFSQAMAGHDLPVVPEWIVHGDLTQGSGHRLAGELLALPQPPTAILAGNDLMALGTMAAIQQRGLSVGRDVSVIGFDDIPQAEHAHPPLTTIHQPIYDIGARITRMLVNVLAGTPLDPRQLLLMPELRIRESTGPAPELDSPGGTVGHHGQPSF